MDGKLLGLLIVAIVFGSITFKEWLKHKSKAAQRSDDAETRALRDQVADLEERVRVLERLATDKRERLKEEIDAL